MTADSPANRRSPLRQLRGKLVVGIRRRLTAPLTARTRLESYRRYHRLRRRLAPHRYTDTDPFTLVRVDPTEINRSVLEWTPRLPQWGRVVGGDWDRRWEPFEERAVYRGLCQRYREGMAWEETALYEAFLDQLERFGNAWEHGSVTAFETRCREIDRLYESIRDQGYRTQADLADVSEPRLAHLRDEINVDVGRDGTLYWRTYGQHRLAIAKLLDLETVPVMIHRRHQRWQALRERCREGEGAPRAAGGDLHPDLRDVLAGDHW